MSVKGRGLRRQKCTGAKHCAEDAGQPCRARRAVGERSNGHEAALARGGGAFGRANVGMSNHKHDGKSCPRKSSVSAAMAIICGLGGPKAMARAAADGQLVNIPALLIYPMEGRMK